MQWKTCFIKTLLDYIDGTIPMRKYKCNTLAPYFTGTLKVKRLNDDSGRYYTKIVLMKLPYFCGGKFIYDMWVSSELEKDERKEVLNVLFRELKNTTVAKLLWADKVNGYIHEAITEVYPDSEVGSIKHNPNSGNNIICGELNIEDM